MRNLKRALSLALASVMLVGMMVVGTSAASFPDVTDEQNVEAIEVLNAVEVMIGDNGDFRPDDNVTRNEMAVIMAKLLLGKDADSYVGTHPFNDVPEWADKYVAACYNEGIVAGRDEAAGIYDGQATVTAEEAAAMMLRALGYEKLEKIGQGYPAEIVKRANNISLFKNVGSNPKAPMTRNQIAQLSLNTLKATVVTSDIEEGIVIDGVITMPTKATYTNMPTSAATSSYEGKLGSATTIELGEKLYEGDLELIPNGSQDDLGRAADLWKYKKEDVVKVAADADYTYTLDDDYTSKSGISDTEDLVQELTDKSDLEANDDPAAKYVLNGNDTATTAQVLAAATYGTVIEVYLNADNNKKFDKVVAYYYTLDKITDVDTDVKDSDAKDGVSAYVTFDTAGPINDNDIAGFNADTYVEDAYVAVIEKDNKIIASYIPEVVESSVSTVKGTEFLTAGGTRYYPGAGYDASVKTIPLGNVSTKADDSYAIYLDKEGNMIGLEEIEGSAASLDDVYYVDAIYAGAPINVVGGTEDPVYAQLIALADGTVSQVRLEEVHKDDGSTDYDTQGSDSYLGTLVTISDKEWTDDNSAKHKKNDNKFDLEAWDHDENDDYDVYTDVSVPQVSGNDVKLETGDTRIGINGKLNGASAANKTIRLNGSTQYIFAEDTGSNLEVKTATGGVAYTFSSTNLGAAAGKAIVVTESGKIYALYMVIPCDDSKQSNTFSEDVIYIHEVSATVGDGFIEQEVYLADGSKETWQIAEGQLEDGTDDDKFFTYAENDDGFIDLEDADALETGSAYVWDDETGWVIGTVDPDKTAWDQSLLSIIESVSGSTYSIEDIKIEGAKVVDLHDTDEEYGRAITSLSRLQQLLDDEKIEDVVVAMNVSKDGVSTIFLLAAPEVTSGGGGGGGQAATAAKLEVTVSFKKGENAVANPGWAKNDSIAFTGNTDGGKTALNATATKGDNGWTVSITAPDTGYTGTFDGTKLTITASATGATNGNPFNTPTATATIADSSVDTVVVGTPQWTDGTDAS